MIKPLVTTAIALLAIVSAQACDNECWLQKNQKAIRTHPELKGIFDQICEQGRATTKHQKRIQKRFHLKKCGRRPVIPTPHEPTPTANPTQAPTITPTPSPASPSPTPSATGTPVPSPTVTPRPTATPSISPTPTATATPITPTPTPSPTCSPQDNCVQTRDWWRDHPDAWPLNQVTLGNVTYTKPQLIEIMQFPGNFGDGLNPMAKEEIAAKLNVASQAGHDCIDDTIAQVDSIIGDLVVQPIGTDTIPVGNVQGFIDKLTEYNKGQLCCAAHCNSEGIDILRGESARGKRTIIYKLP